MKKLLCVLLALSLILSMGTALATEMHEITSNVFPFYDGGEEPSAELTLYSWTERMTCLTWKPMICWRC